MKLKNIPLVMVLLSGVASCSKQSPPPSPSSLTIINGVVGSAPLVTNFSGTDSMTWYLNGNKIAYNSFSTADYSDNNRVALSAGIQQLALYQYPDTLPKDKPLFSLALRLSPGSINTLFLTGTVDAPDTLFTTDQLPQYVSSDSTAGIRFVNLCPHGSPISINIAGRDYGSEVMALPYKGLTGFRRYPATKDVSSYTFEFRDAATGALLTTYTADGVDNTESDPYFPTKIWRYRNTTLALLGLQGGAGGEGPAILTINNY